MATALWRLVVRDRQREHAEEIAFNATKALLDEMTQRMNNLHDHLMRAESQADAYKQKADLAHMEAVAAKEAVLRCERDRDDKSSLIAKLETRIENLARQQQEMLNYQFSMSLPGGKRVTDPPTPPVVHSIDPIDPIRDISDDYPS